MTTKHTPGPWTAAGHGQVIAHARLPAWRTLADVYGVHGDEEQADADARLIAAAPDLLAACEHVRDTIREFLPTVMSEDLTAIEAAIAKAKGET